MSMQNYRSTDQTEEREYKMMFIKNRKLLMLASAIAVALPVTVVSAATTNIDATAVFRAALALSGEVDMDFSDVDFVAPVAGGTVGLGTNGAIVYDGAVFSGAGTGTAGSVSITGTTGLTVDVECEVDATMGDGGGETIDVVSIEVDRLADVGASGTGTACAGIGSAAISFALAGGANVIRLGGVIDGDTASVGFGAGTYSTATGGDDIQIDVIYQ